MIILENDTLCVSIDPLGAEIHSVRRNDMPEFEYLWQADPEFYPHRAIHIFPYVGRSTNGQYRLDGDLHSMPLHGFASESIFDCIQQARDEAAFRLSSDDETRTFFPRAFTFTVTYRLKECGVQIDYLVENTDEKTIYFGLGLHPGFNIPIAEDRTFDEYQLTFSPPCNPLQIGMTDLCFRGGEDMRYTLRNDTALPLTHTLFDHDAIILCDTGGRVKLSAPGSEHSVTLHYSDMPYLSLWHSPKTSAPFLCIEPVTSLPAHQGIVEDFAAQNDLLSIFPHHTYSASLLLEFR